MTEAEKILQEADRQREARGIQSSYAPSAEDAEVRIVRIKGKHVVYMLVALTVCGALIGRYVVRARYRAKQEMVEAWMDRATTIIYAAGVAFEKGVGATSAAKPSNQIRSEG